MGSQQFPGHQLSTVYWMTQMLWRQSWSQKPKKKGTKLIKADCHVKCAIVPRLNLNSNSLLYKLLFGDASLTLGQSHDCPNACEVILKGRGKSNQCMSFMLLIWLQGDSAHTLQGYFTCTEVIIWLPLCRWSNPEEQGSVHQTVQMPTELSKIYNFKKK